MTPSPWHARLWRGKNAFVWLHRGLTQPGRPTKGLPATWMWISQISTSCCQMGSCWPKCAAWIQEPQLPRWVKVLRTQDPDIVSESWPLAFARRNAWRMRHLSKVCLVFSEREGCLKVFAAKKPPKKKWLNIIKANCLVETRWISGAPDDAFGRALTHACIIQYGNRRTTGLKFNQD